MIRKVLIAAILIMPNIALSASYFGAFAYNARTGKLGYAYNRPDKIDAINQALNMCGFGCKVIARFNDVCAAFALGSSAYGWGTSVSIRVAKDSAVEQCYKYGAQRCKVRKTICTRGGSKGSSERKDYNGNQRNRNLKYY